MSRYGGPGTQTVDQRWGVGWDTYLASKRNFIVAQLDVRGSGFQVILPPPLLTPCNQLYLPTTLTYTSYPTLPFTPSPSPPAPPTLINIIIYIYLLPRPP